MRAMLKAVMFAAVALCGAMAAQAAGNVEEPLWLRTGVSGRSGSRPKSARR